MTYSARSLPIPLPTSSLLPPGDFSPTESLPSSLAVLGPLPPTTPLHLALNYLYLSDLPDFETSSTSINAAAGPSSASGSSPIKEKETVLVITGPEEGFVRAVEDDDEDYSRDRGGDYTMLERLRRVDIRSVILPHSA